MTSSAIAELERPSRVACSDLLGHMVIWSLKVSNAALYWSAGETNAARLAALVALGVLALPSAIPRSTVPTHELAAPTREFG
jgi:hypothetical protein